MEEKLKKLYQECLKEWKEAEIENINEEKIEISISKRNNKRYGCCKQEEPDMKTRYIEKKGRRKIIKYAKYNKHHIEISPWVLELEETIIKNTIMHELIHCLPNCNNHGSEFKKHAKEINGKLGYTISRLGNKKEDYQKSNIEYKEEKFNYQIECIKCGQSILRKRINRNFTRKYRCGKCGEKFQIKKLNIK